MSTKKTFELAAEEIKYQLTQVKMDRFTEKEIGLIKEYLISSFITVFKYENPRFDIDRFRNACDGDYSPFKYEKLLER